MGVANFVAIMQGKHQERYGSLSAYKQGGKVSTRVGLQNVSVTLPISVATILTAVGASYTKALGNDSNSGQVYDFTSRSLTLTVDGGVGVWLAICK